jgi:hypothetical protein
MGNILGSHLKKSKKVIQQRLTAFAEYGKMLRNSSIVLLIVICHFKIEVPGKVSLHVEFRFTGMRVNRSGGVKI